tara:strand:- start:1269 stop:1553 length:285 start_codon:yes stop_codon:yes gene_type:complete
MKNIKESMIILMALAGFYTLSFLGFSGMNTHGNGFNLEKHASQEHFHAAMDIEVISVTAAEKDCAEDADNLFMCDDAFAYEVEDDSIFENFKPE